jgi:hypothetical protein
MAGGAADRDAGIKPNLQKKSEAVVVNRNNESTPRVAATLSA